MENTCGHGGEGLVTGVVGDYCVALVLVEVDQTDQRGRRAEFGAEGGEVREFRSRGTTDPLG